MFKNANFFISEFFRSLIGKQPSENITPKIATAIQKQDYFNSINQHNQTYTPAYVLIGYQLLNDKKEIFEASVYYLCTIANNIPQSKNDIINILSDYMKNNSKLTERNDFIKNQMKHYNLK